MAAHEGAPLVLRDLAPGLPKKGPPWDIEGEPGGLKIFTLKRPFEANNEGDATGHTGHHKKIPGPTKIPSVQAPPQNIKSLLTSGPYPSPRRGSEAASHFRLEAHREGAQLEKNNVSTCGHLHLATCHTAVTRTSLAVSHCARWPDSTQPLK